MIRGMVANTAGTVLFIVIGNGVFTSTPLGVRNQIGTLSTTTGTVSMKIGLTQLVIVDGRYGYVYDLDTKVFSSLDSAGWLGSNTVDYLNGYYTFIDPDSQTFYVSGIEDAAYLDVLEFATANTSPDFLVGQVVTGRTLLLFGEVSCEVWQESGDVDFPFAPNTAAYMEVGLLGVHTAKELDNSVYWLGRDERGAGMVFRLEGFRAVRVSTMAVEQKIQEAIRSGADMDKAVAYAYQQGGHSFYVLQIPTLDTTWVFDAAAQQWHERAEFVQGDYQQHRGRFHAYCFGRHLIGGDDDIIYEYDVDANTNAGDVLVRDRISPHMATPSQDRLTFTRFELDCTVGNGVAGQGQANVQVRYSNDGGIKWGDWRTASIGSVGETKARARFLRCGSARDRVWHVRCTDDTPFAIIGANIEVGK